MAYIPGSNPDPLIDSELTDLQNQITNNLAVTVASEAGTHTEIKQVTLTLEGELRTLQAAFDSLKAYVIAKLPS